MSVTAKGRGYTIPTLVAAIRASYDAFSIHIDLLRKYGKDEAATAAAVENRNFLSNVADDLEGKPKWRSARPPWQMSAHESLALTDAVVAKRMASPNYNAAYGVPVSQSDLFAMKDALIEAVRLGIVLPRAAAITADLTESEESNA